MGLDVLLRGMNERPEECREDLPKVPKTPSIRDDASEKSKRSVVPKVFWWLILFGALALRGATRLRHPSGTAARSTAQESPG